MDEAADRSAREAWALSVPGLAADDARRIADDVNVRHGVQALPLDPRHWYTRSLDLATAEIVARALDAALAHAPADAADAAGFLEDLHEWISEVADRGHGDL